jgi:hypothetical protein
MIEDMKTDSEAYEATMRGAQSNSDSESSLRYPTPPTEGSVSSENSEEDDSDATMTEDDTNNADVAP